jgi:hypothetical protein
VTFKSQTFLLTIILLLISSVVGRALACSAQKPESFIELKDAQFVVVGKMLADPDAQDKFFYRGEILVETVLAGDQKICWLISSVSVPKEYEPSFERCLCWHQSYRRTDVRVFSGY